MTAKLCFIEDLGTAFALLYFTEDMSGVWGDDWDNVPYEHNAEPPYGEFVADMFIIRKGNLETPRDRKINSAYSVEQINKGCVPWLTDVFWGGTINIFAGTSSDDVIRLVLLSGGSIWRQSK